MRVAFRNRQTRVEDECRAQMAGYPCPPVPPGETTGY